MMPGSLCLALLFTALLLPGLSSAAEKVTSSVADVESADVLHTAPVRLDGAALFRVAGVSAFPPEQRAQTISGRIQAVAAETSFSTTNLRVVELSDRSNILAGNRFLLSVLDADALAEGVSRQLLAEAMRMRIASAIESYRQDRSPRRLLFSSLYALAATVVLLGVLWGGRRAFRWLDARIEARYRSKIESIEIQALRLIQAEQLWAALHSVLNLIWLLIALVLFYFYWPSVWTRSWGHCRGCSRIYGGLPQSCRGLPLACQIHCKVCRF
jgi:hypothetical protein